MAPSAQDRARDLLTAPPQSVEEGWLDLLGPEPQAGPVTGAAQLLMRAPLLAQVYEHWWRPALGRLAKGPFGPGMAQERHLAAEALVLRPGMVVLDVACGTGAFTRSFADRVGPGGLVIGLDASAPMLRRAVAATSPEAPIAYVRGDAGHPPLQAGSLDGLCCFAALHMLARPFEALRAYLRLLRPGGHLVLLTSRRRQIPVWHEVEGLLMAASGQRGFDLGEIGRALTEAGAEVTQERGFGLAQLVAARVPGSPGRPAARNR